MAIIQTPDAVPAYGSGPHGHTNQAIGCKRWAIADGYIPGWSNGREPEMVSHGTLSMLNATEFDAYIRITVFYADRDPVGPYPVVVPARRTKHVRMDKLREPEPIPTGTDYAAVIESDVPIVVQHTRLDSRQAENGLITTIAFAGGD